MRFRIHRNKLGVQWLFAVALLVHSGRSFESVSCNFNSMCTCNYESETQKVHDISCVAVPFYKFPSIPELSISHMEIQGSNIMSLERVSLSTVKIQSLTAANNKLQSISEKSFSFMSEVLSSLDLSYNKLDFIPFNALQDLKNLQWLNLYGNNINSIDGDWSNVKHTLANLFLGGNDITVLPSDIDHISRFQTLRQFKSLIWLNLDSNRISKLSRHSLPLALQTLSISHNLLEEIPHELLDEMPHLQWLYLRDNHIIEIPSKKTFPKNVRLEKIDLSENSLRSLPRNPFNNSLYVRDLNLAFNKIQNILADSFLGLECGRVILSHNEIETVDRKAFTGLNESLEYLDFDHNNLIHIPFALNLLTQLKYLYLSSNLITHIPENAFMEFNSKLKALSLSGNRLSKVPYDALQNCTEISYLNIGYNEIYELSDTDFEWGLHLKTLLLRNNRIVHLKEKVFSTLKFLKELSLSFNPLRYVDANAFEGLSGLDSLEISFSLDWEEFPQDILKPLSNLQWLTMDNNNFKTIPEQSLIDLNQLRYVNLEGNKLEVIPVNLFQNFVHTYLTDIRLSNNNLEVILSNTFDGILSLQTIILSGNEIKTLQSNSFTNMTNLTTLILCDNRISQIFYQCFSNLPNLKQLDLHSNKLTEFSFKVFTNVSNLSPLILNISKNYISYCESDNKIVNIEIFDLRINNFGHIPACLENISALKKLYLDLNNIGILGHNTFMHQTSLESLTLSSNNISFIHKHAFFGLQNLQVLDLTNNRISVLHVSQFSNMPRLRILKLRHNRLNYLPKDVFSSTQLEMLDLRYNFFNVVPSMALTEIGETLRYLSLGFNNIEHVDSTTFPDFPNIQHLDLSSNKLTILPDNVFTSLGLLQKLDLSSNVLRANFKELFHYAQSLKDLHLSNNGFNSVPHLPLPNLVYLNLSFNHISSVGKTAMQDLKQLKFLYLNNNKLLTVPAQVWTHLPSLKTLDLSFNPIKEISSGSFSGLNNLQNLNINHLDHIRKFESRSIMQLSLLSSLSMQTWPHLDNFRAEFCFLLANLTRLRSLKLNIKETKVNEQLRCIESNKLKFIQVSGDHLKYVSRDVFQKFSRNPELLIRITDTQIEELPAGLFSGLNKVSHLTIDIRNNLLTYLSPDIFYSNATTWKNVGTTLISGGLLVSKNPWKCGCHLAWLGHWLRRWTRESLQSHTAPVTTLIRVNELIKEATCVNLRTGKRVPIVKLSAEDMSCHASALSDAERTKGRLFFGVVICVVIVNVF